jgi:hypothetical protein
MTQPTDSYIDPTQKEILIVDVIKKQLIRILIIYLLVTNVFIFLRMLLRLLGADPANMFAGFIFMVSGLFLLPFYGIFPQYREEIVAGKMYADVSAFVALFCSNVLVCLAMCLIFVLTRIVKTRKQANETVERSKPVDTTIAEESVD